MKLFLSSCESLRSSASLISSHARSSVFIAFTSTPYFLASFCNCFDKSCRTFTSIAFSRPERAFHCTVNIPVFTLSYALRILLSSDKVNSLRDSIDLTHSISFAYARAILGELSNCSNISKSASLATGDCTLASTFDRFLVIPLYISSDCFINTSASSSLPFPASHLDNMYVHSS